MRIANQNKSNFFNSAAAFSVKVNATISAGSTPSVTRDEILRANDSVFPDPAQATIRKCPPRWEIACCCWRDGRKLVIGKLN